MKQYMHIETKQIFSYSGLSLFAKDTSVPLEEKLTAEKLDYFGFAYIEFTERPAETALLWYEEAEPMLVNGEWENAWVATQRYPTESERVDALKTDLLIKLKAYHSQVEGGGILRNGIHVNTDSAGMSRLALAEAPDGGTVDFISNGTWYDLDSTAINSLKADVTKFGQDCFSYYRVLHTSIDACTNVGQLEAIDINVGWPV